MEILEGQYSKLSIVDLTTNKEIVVITDDQITTTDDFAVNLEPAWTNASITKAAPKERRKGDDNLNRIKIPACIDDRLEELNELCDRYPESIPTHAAAGFLRIHPENLKACIETGNCPFAFYWKKNIDGYRAFKIPTVTFYIWYTKGFALI